MRAKILFLVLLVLFGLGASRVRMLIYREPGFQGEWASPVCEYGEYDPDQGCCKALKYEVFVPAGGVDWFGAKSFCMDRGGHLITITSAGEEQKFEELWTAAGGVNLWIGLNDLEEEGQWEWVTGEPVTYTKWASGQPDNWGDQDCVRMVTEAHSSAAGRWADEDCSRTVDGLEQPFGLVCEYDLPGDPCPEGYTYVREGTRGFCVNVPGKTCEYGEYDLGRDACVAVKYEVLPEINVDWFYAKEACADLGGHLVTVGSAEEEQRVEELWTAAGGNAHWIGFNDLEEEGQWEWVTGEPVTYTKWAPNEPNNYNNSQHCAHIIGTAGRYPGYWGDNYCTASKDFGAICEYDLPGDPCPEGYAYVREGTRGLCVKEF